MKTKIVFLFILVCSLYKIQAQFIADYVYPDTLEVLVHDKGIIETPEIHLDTIRKYTRTLTYVRIMNMSTSTIRVAKLRTSDGGSLARFINEENLIYIHPENSELFYISYEPHGRGNTMRQIRMLINYLGYYALDRDIRVYFPLYAYIIPKDD